MDVIRRQGVFQYGFVEVATGFVSDGMKPATISAKTGVIDVSAMGRIWPFAPSLIRLWLGSQCIT
jgi:hypothetical protein